MRHLSPSPRAARRASRQRGVGLIELMIAVLVLSVGLFGIVLSQLNLLRAQRQAQQRLTAIQLAGGMAERMRLNVAAFAGSGGAAYQDAASTYQSLRQAGAPAAPSMPTSFDPLSQAAYDLASWRHEIGQRLDASTAAGVVRAQAHNPYGRSVVVMWVEAQPTGALRSAGGLTRDASCPAGSSASALVCDRSCPADGLVAGAPMRVRCFELEVTP